MTKTHLTALCCIILAFASTSCGKKGCTDPLANNHDPEATKDDGGCTYDPANALVGTYITTDTLLDLTSLDWSTNTATYQTLYSQRGLVISKQDANTVNISSFGLCQEVVHATVSTSSLIINNNNIDCSLGGKIINLNGKNLPQFLQVLSRRRHLLVSIIGSLRLPLIYAVLVLAWLLKSETSNYWQL